MRNTNSLKQKVYDAVVKDIARGTYAPGYIMTESKLSEKYQVSKAPVREALIELGKDNYVTNLPRIGYQVVPCTLKEIADILDFRSDMELCNLHRAFQLLSENKLAKFSKEWEQYQKQTPHTDDLAINWMRNQKFHLLVCSLSGNAYAYQELERLLRQNARFFAQYYLYAWNNNTESKGKYHDAIIEAIMDRNEEKTCSLLREDINSVKDQITHLLNQGNTPR